MCKERPRRRGERVCGRTCRERDPQAPSVPVVPSRQSSDSDVHGSAPGRGPSRAEPIWAGPSRAPVTAHQGLRPVEVSAERGEGAPVGAPTHTQSILTSTIQRSVSSSLCTAYGQDT